MSRREDSKDRWSRLGDLESGLGGPYVGAGAVVEEPSRVIHAGHEAGSYAKDEKLASEVAHALNLHPAVVASGLSVSALEGVVALRGSVPDEPMRKVAEELTLQVNGVASVENHLRIEHTSLETRHRR